MWIGWASNRKLATDLTQNGTTDPINYHAGLLTGSVHYAVLLLLLGHAAHRGDEMLLGLGHKHLSLHIHIERVCVTRMIFSYTASGLELKLF
jgi:hypothetical protein